MPLYNNSGRDSGIHSYDIEDEKITVTFTTNACYEYSYRSAGVEHIENMKSLALKGEGLNSYINRNVKYKYSRKIR